MESISKFGPMPAAFAQKLQTLLEEEMRPIKIYSTQELQQNVREELKKQLGNPYPTYSGGHDSMYVEIRTEDLLIVKAELEKMGFPFKKQNTEGDFSPEYLCVKCDFKSDYPGRCPTHQRQLLEYSDWHAEKSKTQRPTRVLIIAALLAAAFFIFYGLNFFNV